MTQANEQAIFPGTIALETNRNTGIAAKLLPGMYVRVPLDIEYAPHFRDFRLGQIRSLDEIANMARVHFYDKVEEEPDDIEVSLEELDRCFILPSTDCQFTTNEQQGYLLHRCGDMFVDGKFVEYFVLTEKSSGVIRVRENEIRVFRNRQDYDPWAQLSNYEFQQPIWRTPRDHFVEVYTELRNATFGLDELLGARLMLFAHQAETIARVLADTTCRYILADEVGLGKTIEACVILKGLRRRHGHLRTLMIVPTALAMQWQNELNARFWLNIPLVREKNALAQASENGCILCVEDLARDEHLWQAVQQQHWDLLLLDEAHHLIKQNQLYQRMRQLSAATLRVLILSATPIQRRKQEYLALLALVNPERYDRENASAFAQLLASQQKIVKQIAILGRILGNFDAEEFLEELEPVTRLLREDQELAQRVNRLSLYTRQKDGGKQQARELLSYLSENYRIERRIIRNRRVHLTVPLPSRKLNTEYRYKPGELESEALDRLYDYLEEYIKHHSQTPLLTEFVRVWMHAAASSPHALSALARTRQEQMAQPSTVRTASELATAQFSTNPRQEIARLERLCAWAPSLPEENEQWIEPLLRATTAWQEETQTLLERAGASLREISQAGEHRLLQVLQAVHTLSSSNPKVKILLFANWLPTIEALYPILHKRYGGLALARFTSDMDDEELQEEVDRFQRDPACRFLLCDELGGEGRNFQIADQVIHIDLPWTPAQVEQRIGRIDRIGRSGEVVSIVPFAQGWPEEALFRLWQDAFQLFTSSMSGLEIALEGVQDDIYNALLRSVRHGLEQLLPSMVKRAQDIRDEVEEERYYEEAIINKRLREEFDQLSEKYRNGKHLEEACWMWANKAGLQMDTDRDNPQIIRFNPRRFNIASLKNAKFLHFPDMQEALARSRHKRDLVVQGTFDRDLAVRREDLVFFAPGNDPWIDAIIENAICADRGRCCAIHRRVPGLKKSWRGFELFYSLTIDPRPLYQRGFDPTHLFQALGFLLTSSYRLIISAKGGLESKSSPVGKILQTSWRKTKDIHLGERGQQQGAASNIRQFKAAFPVDAWQAAIGLVRSRAEKALAEEFDDYMDEVAEEALELFDQRTLGLRFASAWQLQHTSTSGITAEELRNFDAISEALAEGIRHPIQHLESVCFWYLQGE